MRDLLALLLISTIIATTSTIAAAQEYTATPVADAYVSQANPNTNYGVSTALFARNYSPSSLVSLIRFDIENPAEIKTARLFLYYSSGTVANVDLYETARGWDETGITWNNAPASEGYITTLETVSNWNSVDVTGAIRNNKGLFIRRPDNSITIAPFSSRQSAQSPYLVYEYHVTPTPSATATPAAHSEVIVLPSGNVARMEMQATAGEAFIVILLMLLLALGTFALLRYIAHTTAWGE
jgi:hypothetical protein